MIRRVSTDVIKVEGRVHRFNLYYDRPNWFGHRIFGQRHIVMSNGHVVPRPAERF